MSYLIKVFDRRMYPGMGDAYSQVWRDINAWGAWCAVHVHQDAGPPGARGFTILYRNAKSFAEIMRRAFREQLLPLGVPDRGLMYRTNVSVLNNANMPAVLCECGFYTSREDELVGTGPYAQAIALGVRRFAPEGVKVAIAASLQGAPEEPLATEIARRAAELLSEEGEEEDMAKMTIPACTDRVGNPVQSSVIPGGLVYNVPTFRRDWWLDIAHEEGQGVYVTVFFHPQRKVNTNDYKLLEKEPVPMMSHTTPGLHFCPMARWGSLPEWLVVSIHASAPVTVVVGP